MKTTTTKHDSRINRDNNWGTFLEICKEYTGRDFSGGMMSWDELKTTSYMDRTKGLDTQVDCHLDFNTNTITITEK